jgi:hypothetical protein
MAIKRVDRGPDNPSSIRDLLTAIPISAGAFMTGRRFMNSPDRHVSSQLAAAQSTPSIIKDLSYLSLARAAEDNRINNFVERVTEYVHPSIQNSMWGTTINAPLKPQEFLFAWEVASKTLPEEYRSAIWPGGISAEQPIAAARQIFHHQLPKLDVQYREQFMQAMNANLRAVKNLPEGIDISAMVPDKSKIGITNFIEQSVMDISAMPGHLQPALKRIQEKLGYDIRGMYRAAPEWANARMGEWKLWLGEGLSMVLPQTAQGQILTGKSLSTRRLAGTFSVFDEATKTVQTMTTEEYLLYRTERDIVPKITQGHIEGPRAIQREMDQLRQNIYGSMEVVPAVPPALEGEALRGYAKLHSQYTHLVTPAGTPIELAEAAKLPGLRERVGKEFFPTSVAQMEGGKAATINMAELFRGGAAAPPQRSLSKTFRPVGVMESRTGTPYKYNFDWLFAPKYKEMFGEHPGVLAQTVFMKENMPTGLEPIFGEGEFEASRQWLERAQGIRDISAKVPHLAPNIESLFTPQGSMIAESITLPKNTILGWDETWNPIVLHNSSRLKGLSKHDLNAHLFFEDIVSEEQPKMFLSKMRALPIENRLLETTQQALGLPFTPEARLPIGMLGKELHVANMQQTSQLFQTLAERKEFNIARMRSLSRWINTPGSPLDQYSRWTAERKALALDTRGFYGFVTHPGETMDKLVAAATVEGRYQHARYTAGLMDIALQAKLGTQQMGQIFGAAPEILGADWQEQIRRSGLTRELTPAYVKAIEETAPIGTIFMTASGPRSEQFKAHAAASMEPRLFTMLETGPYGQLGTDLSQELAKRAAIDNPAAMQASKAVMDSLASFNRTKAATPNLPRFRLQDTFSQETFDEFLKTGGNLEVGAGRADVYVPGMEQVKLMMPYETPEGRQTYNEFLNTYTQLAREATAVKRGELSQEAFLSTNIAKTGPYKGMAEGAYWRTAQIIQRQQAPFGKGMLGLFRGSSQRVTGSRFLELTSRLGDTTAEQLVASAGGQRNVGGMSDYTFMQEIQESLQAGIFSKEEA